MLPQSLRALSVSTVGTGTVVLALVLACLCIVGAIGLESDDVAHTPTSRRFGRSAFATWLHGCGLCPHAVPIYSSL